jgi:hypothetical protein
MGAVSNWTIVVVVVTAFILFAAVVFSLVAYLGWRGLSERDDED